MPLQIGPARLRNRELMVNTELAPQSSDEGQSVGEPPDCNQTQVYGGRRVVPLFKGYAVPGDHGLVESEPGL